MLDSHLVRALALRPGRPLASSLARPRPIIICLIIVATWFAPSLIPPAQSLLQLAKPAAWMSQVASLTGQAPKLGSAPLVQLDTSSKYYKTMIDGMMNNFKLAVSKASERPSYNKNLTLLPQVDITSNKLSVGSASCSQLQVEGIERPRVSGVRLNKSNMTLQVSFIYKSMRVHGRCQLPNFQTPLVSSDTKPLMEAHYWNASWTASVMPMIGREHFDLRKVASGHRQQKLSLSGLKEAPKSVQQRLQAALVERLEKTIDARMVEIMETVMMERGVASSDARTPEKAPLSKRHLKRNKRQTPCSPGEELDDYVDQLFRFGTRIVRAMEPITLPNATIELPDYNLKIFLYEGRGTRAYKFRRAKSAWVFCSNETISLGLTIEVEELRVAYKYRVISGNRLVFDGDLEAKLSPKVQAQFSQAVQEEDSEEPVQQRVDRLRVFRLGRVHVLIRGLGNLTQSLSMLINSYLNDNQEELQPTFRMVEGDAVKMINKMLANVNVPLLSVV